MNLAYPLGDLLLLGDRRDGVRDGALASEPLRTADHPRASCASGSLTASISSARSQKSYSQGGALRCDRLGRLHARRARRLAARRDDPPALLAGDDAHCARARCVFGVLGLALLFAGTVTHVNALATALASACAARRARASDDDVPRKERPARRHAPPGADGLADRPGQQPRDAARARRAASRSRADRSRSRSSTSTASSPTTTASGIRPATRCSNAPAADWPLTVDGRGRRLPRRRRRVLRDARLRPRFDRDDDRALPPRAQRARRGVRRGGLAPGVVHVPEEASDASSAMRLADLRLYDEKHLRSRRPAPSGRAGALVQMMREQNAERSTHLSRVARLARAVCRQLACPPSRSTRLCAPPSCTTSG